MAFEIPVYRFKPEVPFEEAKAMVLRLNEFLADAPGFRSRKTCYDPKANTWIDFVEWETMEHALAGFNDFSKTDLCQQFVAIADPAFNLMHHAEVVQEFHASR